MPVELKSLFASTMNKFKTRKEELDRIGTAVDVVFAILGHSANIFSEVLELQISALEGKPAATTAAAAAPETDETPERIPVAKASGEQKKSVLVSLNMVLLYSWFHFFLC